ncbi:hypothetical protein E1292_19750 [Nonomuraea deserti]|uniref:Uncharacterized protein n=1 Tax=Nonomuraea deserti TaxID=1848322 RepID=A0A4R4VF79_9ACTN|nr:hypothetical protein [Nonomuraea deserti]TDD04032.1 hypothetical protein E1292_19750 [Nonomuraea deserti]
MVGWQEVRRFSAGPGATNVPVKIRADLELRARRERRTVLWGSSGRRGRSGWEACAFAGRSGDGPLRLFLDFELRTPLCGAEQEDGGYAALDAHGARIGTIRSVPGRLGHAWRIEQPGFAAIEGRNRWSPSGGRLGRSARELLPGTLVEAVLSTAAGPGASAAGPESPFPPRTLVWLAGDQEVMRSQGHRLATISADRLDRRLAFLAVLLEARYR